MSSQIINDDQNVVTDVGGGIISSVNNFGPTATTIGDDTTKNDYVNMDEPRVRLKVDHQDLHNYPPFQSFSMDSTEVSVNNIHSGNSSSDEDIDLIDMEEESFYSSSTNEHGDDNIWGLLSGVAGNIYEWYDFAVYGLLSSEIGTCFFPQGDKRMQLLSSFGVFLAAFIMRPIGAIVFGEIGDRLWGRKNALIMSIVMITVPSVLMGLLPGYATLGPSSCVILVILRMVQGLSVGGQLAGSYVMSIEQSTIHNRGFRGSVCDASSVGGFLLASLVTTIVRTIFDVEQVYNWAWRIPFWFSLVLAPILYKIVKETEESKFWAERSEQKEMEQIIREVENKQQTPAVVDLFSSPFYRRQLFGMIGVLGGTSSAFYMLMLFTPIYLSDLRELMGQKQADFLNLIIVAIHIVFVVICGKLSDTFLHRSDMIKMGLTGLIAAGPVMFGMFECESVAGILLSQVQFSLCLAICQGGIAAWEVELWMADPTLSFTGVAVGHNAASTIFGGTVPIFATTLYYYSDGLNEDEDDIYKRLIPGLFVSLLGMMALISLSFVVRHPHDLRTGEKKLRNIRNLDRKLEKKRRKRDIERNWLSNTVGSWTEAPAEPSSYIPPKAG